MELAASRVICIGGAAVDRKYRALSSLRPATSNPVTSERSFGGVARNVAENTARLGTAAAALTVESGASVRPDLSLALLETTLSLRAAG